jgi:hypothetical protein
MPCRSDYMEPNEHEVALSQVCCVLDELAAKKVKESWWTGEHPKVYRKGISRLEADAWTAEACKKCRNEEASGNLHNHSLELQLWWREHKKKDKAREEAEEKAKTAIKHVKAIRALIKDYLKEHDISSESVEIRIR